MWIWALFSLLLFLRPSQSRIECELLADKSNKFSVSDELLKNLKYNGDNTQESMENLECFCLNSQDGEPNYISDSFQTELRKKVENWTRAQNFIIRDCETLSVSFENGAPNLNKHFIGGYILFLNIRELFILDLALGSDGPMRNYVGVIFKNVKIMRSVKQLSFIDMYEVRLSNVSVSTDLNNIEIKMINGDMSKGVEPQLIIENSDFRIGSQRARDTPFYFTVDNEQVARNQCLAQLGRFIITNNYFDNLADDTVMMTRGSEFEFSRNKIEYIRQRSIQLKNIKKILFINNFLGVPQNNAIQILALRQPSSCSPKMEAIQEIEQVTFNNNKMSKSSIDFVNVNIEGGSKPSDVLEKFEISNNDILVPCNCQNLMTANAKSSLADLISILFTSTSKCFSTQGLVGKRSSICSGDEPPKPEEILEQRETEVKGQYVTYVVIGTIVGFILGAMIGAGLIYMCMGDKGSITPRDSPSR